MSYHKNTGLQMGWYSNDALGSSTGIGAGGGLSLDIGFDHDDESIMDSQGRTVADTYEVDLVLCSANTGTSYSIDDENRYYPSFIFSIEVGPGIGYYKHTTYSKTTIWFNDPVEEDQSQVSPQHNDYSDEWNNYDFYMIPYQH